jgi:hypothetical protein
MVLNSLESTWEALNENARTGETGSFFGSKWREAFVFLIDFEIVANFLIWVRLVKIVFCHRGAENTEPTRQKRISVVPAGLLSLFGTMNPAINHARVLLPIFKCPGGTKSGVAAAALQDASANAR